MQRVKSVWTYIINHKWSKDILRANLFYVLLVVVFDLIRFGLRPIGWGVAIKLWLLMNLCLFFKLVLDIIDRLLRRTR